MRSAFSTFLLPVLHHAVDTDVTPSATSTSSEDTAGENTAKSVLRDDILAVHQQI